MSDLIVGAWGARFRGRFFPCAIGRGGLVAASAKREGDGATPTGCYALLGGYWRADRLPRPATHLPLRAIGPRDGWSDAPADPAYNTAVTLPHRHSAERMARADRLYDLVVFTDHNTPAVAGLGSAVFVHCWRSPRHPTAGCIAFRRDHLRWILARLGPRSRLVVRHA
ncbi:MAG: L,D-transpeptidase family protein [Pseudomonadota bacterium]